MFNLKLNAMKKIFGMILACTSAVFLTSCFDGSSSSSRVEDDKYWESINREQALKDAGLYEAAKLEQKARLNYMKGGGYNSPSGGKQVHYKGSKEQKRDLEMIDAYFNEHGWD